MAVRYAQGGEEISKKALVLTMYYEEPPTSETNQTYYAYEEPGALEQWTTEASNFTVSNEGKVSLDIPTLMFIASQGGRLILHGNTEQFQLHQDCVTNVVETI